MRHEPAPTCSDTLEAVDAPAEELEGLGAGWSPSDEPQSCIDKATELCGHCGEKKNLCWVRCAKHNEAALKAAGCSAPTAAAAAEEERLEDGAEVIEAPARCSAVQVAALDYCL